jgi:integrase
VAPGLEVLGVAFWRDVREVLEPQAIAARFQDADGTRSWGWAEWNCAVSPAEVIAQGLPRDGLGAPVDEAALGDATLVRVTDGLRVPASLVPRLMGREITAAAVASLLGAPERLATDDTPREGPVSAELTSKLIDGWLASIDGSTEADTRKEYRRIACVHWLPFFQRTDALNGATGTRSAKRYTNERLKCVSREMVKKELSPLRGFATWLEGEGLIGETPHIPPPPKRATGKRSLTHKREPVPVTEDEVEAVLAALPETTRARRGTKRIVVRDRFTFAWETGLRPNSTLAKVSVPEHWHRGKKTLKITKDIDKARFGREVALTPRAIEILERNAPEKGVVFGRHDLRAQLKKAATDAGLEEGRAKWFSQYDFRHARSDFLLDAFNDPRAVAFNHGHKRLSTTLDTYTRPSPKNHARMIAKLAARSGASAEPSGASAKPTRIGGTATIAPEGVLDEAQAGEYTSLPTRTWRNWQTHQIQVLAG